MEKGTFSRTGANPIASRSATRSATPSPFVLTCLLSDLTGQVTGTCNGQTSGLQGVTVDVFGDDGHGMDVLVATTGTDASGSYRFGDLALGTYAVGIVLPLGYSTGSASRSVTLATPDGSLAAQAFPLQPEPGQPGDRLRPRGHHHPGQAAPAPAAPDRGPR